MPGALALKSDLNVSLIFRLRGWWWKTKDTRPQHIPWISFDYISLYINVWYLLQYVFTLWSFFPLQDCGYGRTRVPQTVRPMLAIRCIGHGRVHQDDHSGAWKRSSTFGGTQVAKIWPRCCHELSCYVYYMYKVVSCTYIITWYVYIYIYYHGFYILANII